MLFISHLIQKNRLPNGKEWIQISIYGVLNISIYLGLYVVAMQKVTAGIGALAVAINPVLISFISFIFLKKKLTLQLIVALLTCTIGVICTSWPLLQNSTVTLVGLFILFGSMLSYALASLYFANKEWGNLALLTINGWQTLIGGIILLPFAFAFYQTELNNFNTRFFTTVFWLAIPVSIIAIQLWFWLLRKNSIKASLWLFLCPIFGFIFAALLAKESISYYTVLGLIFVLIGLFITKRD